MKEGGRRRIHKKVLKIEAKNFLERLSTRDPPHRIKGGLRLGQELQ